MKGETFKYTTEEVKIGRKGHYAVQYKDKMYIKSTHHSKFIESLCFIAKTPSVSEFV